MEIVILDGRAGHRRARRRRHRRRCSSASPTRCSAWRPAPRRWRSTTSWRGACAAGEVSFAEARGFTLDEYVGLPADHPQRYRNVIDTDFVSRVDFAPDAVQGPDGLAEDIPAACAAYEAAIAEAGGVDLQILGIGTDGHIGVQRARLLAGVADPHQDVDPADAARQRPVLRRRPRCGAHPLPHPGAGHDHVRPARRAGRHRPGQGRGGPPPGRGRGQRPVAGDASCSTTRTSPCCWTTPPRAGCSWPTTTGRPTAPSRRGRASDADRGGSRRHARVGAAARLDRRRRRPSRRASGPETRRAPPISTSVPAVVVPGFVDMHVHGGGGGAFPSGDLEIRAPRRPGAPPARHHHDDRLAGDRGRRRAARGRSRRSPSWSRTARSPASTSRDPGCRPDARARTSRRLLRDPDPAELDRVLAAGRGAIRMVTLAPERQGGLDAIRRVVDAGAVAAVGHTDATYDQARAAIDAGATVATHLFNAMRPVHHREPGPVVALLEDPRVTVELIADGVHLHPALYRQVSAGVGADRVALVTDAMAAAGMADGAYRLGSLAVDGRRRRRSAHRDRHHRRQHRDHGPGVRLGGAHQRVAARRRTRPGVAADIGDARRRVGSRRPRCHRPRCGGGSGSAGLRPRADGRVAARRMARAAGDWCGRALRPRIEGVRHATSAAAPPVSRTSSSNVVGKTARG